MISRKNRFHGYGSLRYVYQHGRTVRGPMCSVKFVINERRKTYRLAVVVSKKVNKSAVVRNRIRRRIYELVRKHDAEIAKPYDIVITAFHEQMAELPAPELERMVRSQFRQAGILTKAPKPQA
jgi:ribonuclease P protein component